MFAADLGEGYLAPTGSVSLTGLTTAWTVPPGVHRISVSLTDGGQGGQGQSGGEAVTYCNQNIDNTWDCSWYINAGPSGYPGAQGATTAVGTYAVIPNTILYVTIGRGGAGGAQGADGWYTSGNFWTDQSQVNAGSAGSAGSPGTSSSISGLTNYLYPNAPVAVGGGGGVGGGAATYGVGGVGYDGGVYISW